MATVIRSFPEIAERREADPLLGELLIDAGKLAPGDIDRIVVAQQKEHLRFGEAAVMLGLAKHDDIHRALARQFDYPYVEETTSKVDARLIAAYQPFGPYAEALRGLRTQLMMRWFNENRKTLAVIAPRASTAPSVAAANLAIVFAQLGERTLLIDANLRAPMQHSLFGVENRWGLTNVLAGRLSAKDMLLSIDPFENLSILCAGPLVPNPQELLARVTFSYWMETLPAGFDVVIVDTPPILDYADAQLIAARTGGCLLVTHRHRTRYGEIERMRRELEPSGASIVGAVIKDW